MLTTISDLKSATAAKTKAAHMSIDTNCSSQARVEANKSQVSEIVTLDSRFVMERFLNPLTRDDAFRDLFAEVNLLNDSVASLKELFDPDGDFMIQEYLNSDFRISRSTFDNVSQKVSFAFALK